MKIRYQYIITMCYLQLQIILSVIVVFSCCPECRSHGIISVSSNLVALNGSHCVFRGWHYQVHDTFRIDPCSRCTCQSGGMVCKRSVLSNSIRSMFSMFYYIIRKHYFPLHTSRSSLFQICLSIQKM